VDDPDDSLSSNDKAHDGSQSWDEHKQCVVVNFSDEELQVTVKHRAGKYTEQGGSPGLKPGESCTLDVTCTSWTEDFWSIWIYQEESKLAWYRDDKECLVKYDDVDSASPLYILFFKPDDGWSLQTPVTASCNLNHYDRD